ncbi:hypothetical protein PMAYCL1PPCAC_11035, partial [Pristionchus mayeri]
DDERKKLINRYKLVIKMQEEYDAMEKRIEEALRPAVGEDAATTAADSPPVESAAAAEEEEAARESNEEICCICREALSKKRSVVLDVCKHSLHETCAVQLFETRSEMEFTCCLCRRKSSKVIGNDEVEIPVPHRNEGLRGSISKTRDHFERLLQLKRIAIRDGKNEEYIADIDEEIELLKKRKLALDVDYMIRCQKKLIKERREAAAATAAAESAAVSADATAGDVVEQQREETEAGPSSSVASSGSTVSDSHSTVVTTEGGEPMDVEAVATEAVGEGRRRRAVEEETAGSTVVQQKRRR